MKLQIKTDGKQFQAPVEEPCTNVEGQQVTDEGLESEEENVDVMEVHSYIMCEYIQ